MKHAGANIREISLKQPSAEIRQRWHGLAEPIEPVPVDINEYDYWTKDGFLLTCPVCAARSNRSGGTDRIVLRSAGWLAVDIAWVCAGPCEEAWKDGGPRPAPSHPHANL